jgi:hypothetical protein
MLCPGSQVYDMGNEGDGDFFLLYCYQPNLTER